MMKRLAWMLSVAMASVAMGQGLPPIESVRPLPRSFAWCEQDNRIWERADLADVRQVARICGTAAIRIDGDRLRAEHVRAAAKLAGELRISLVGVWSPWGFGLAAGTAPSAPDAELQPARVRHLRWARLSTQWLADANRELGTNVRYGWLVLDFERWRYSSATHARLVEFTALCTNVYGADVGHEWYAAGQRKLTARGWLSDTYGAENLPGVASYGVVLYQVARPEYDQARFTQTAAAAAAAGVAWVTPWVALDAGWAPRLGWWPEGSPSWFGVSETWEFGDRYPVPDWCAWHAGLWLCSGSAGPPEHPSNKPVRRGVFYPSPLDPRCPHGLRQLQLFAMGARAMPTTTKPGA